MTTTGLKDHQIAQLVNAIRDNPGGLPMFKGYRSLRQLIAQAIIKYLEGNNLRLDKPVLTESPCRWKIRSCQ